MRATARPLSAGGARRARGWLRQRRQFGLDLGIGQVFEGGQRLQGRDSRKNLAVHRQRLALVCRSNHLQQAILSEPPHTSIKLPGSFYQALRGFTDGQQIGPIAVVEMEQRHFQDEREHLSIEMAEMRRPDLFWRAIIRQTLRAISHGRSYLFRGPRLQRHFVHRAGFHVPARRPVSPFFRRRLYFWTDRAMERPPAFARRPQAIEYESRPVMCDPREIGKLLVKENDHTMFLNNYAWTGATDGFCA